MVFYSGSNVFTGDTSIHYSHRSALDLDLSLEISALTGLISLSVGDEE